MRQTGQDLTLVPEVAQDEIRIHPPLYEFQRHLLLKMTVGASRPIDRSHPALRDFFSDIVGPDALSRPRFRRGGHDQGESIRKPSDCA